MAKKKAKKQELNVWTAKSYELVKDGDKVALVSGSGFYDEKRDNADINLKVTVEEL